MRRKKKHKLFSPDEVVTTLSQALDRDLEQANKLESLAPTALSVLITAQQAAFRKKYVPECGAQEELESLAFDKFISVNRHLSEYTFVPPERLQSSSSFRDRVLIRTRSLLKLVLGNFSNDEWFTACQNSKGSSIGVPYVDTSQERKMTYPLSVTERARPIFEQYLYWDTTYSDAIDSLNSHNICDKYSIVDGSRATTVPKSDSIRRMIAIEPTCNMFLQQGLMKILYRRLKKVGLDVSELPGAHTYRAFEGSVGRHLATIDFSSASDCVHTELLRCVLPPKWFYVLNLVRCDRMEINSSFVELNMFSTMGNACTFPLETLIFWALACATKSVVRDPTNSTFTVPSDRSNISVFGDDCVLPSALAIPFMETATSMGFIVNTEKSFWSNAEAFRESCGGDYHAGCDVRPFYLKAPTSTRLSALEPWLYTILNGLTSLLIKLFGPLHYMYKSQLLLAISELFARYRIKLRLVPPYFPDDSGYNQGDDIRLIRNYHMALQPMKRTHHGTFSFSFCTYRYKEQNAVNPYLRYSLELKKLELRKRSKEASPRFSPRRVRGGYVVGNGLSSHWELQWNAIR